MKRILIILLVLVALLAAGGFFLVKKYITPLDLPAYIVDAEEAMAAPGTIAIASVDMTYLRKVEKLLNPDKDPSPLPAAHTADKKTLLDKLKRQGIDVVAATDYALGTINVSQQKPAYSLVLYGRFAAEQFRKALSQHYQVEESANGTLLITQNAEPVKDPCADPTKLPAPKQQALLLQNNRILLSSPELMPVLLKRFSEKALAGVPLGNWRKFRKQKAVAAAVIAPAEAKKGAVDLPSAIIMGALSQQPLKEVYAGAVINVLPQPGFTMQVDAHANKATWPLEVKTKYDAWAADAMLELQDMPTVAALVKSLDVQADGNILHFKTLANKKTLDNLEKIPGEFVQMAFTGVFGGEKARPAGAEQVVKDNEVEKYQPQFDFSAVEPFDDKPAVYKPDYLAGPIAIRLKKIALFDADDSVLELEVNAQGKGFENLPGEMMHQSTNSPVAGLSITRVEDKAGNNLLREELCGPARNAVMASLSTMRDKEFKNNEWISKSIGVQGNKSVRLKPNVTLSDVALIKGHVAIQAATKTSTKTLQVPLFRKTIQTGSVRMFFRKNTPSGVRYTLSGDSNKILAVRAKNAKGQYLASDGSSAVGSDTKMVSKRFKGKVASVEVVVADAMQTKDYPFEISQVGPRYGKEGDGRTQVDLMVTSKKHFLRRHKDMQYKEEDCKDKQKFRAGTFMVCMDKFGSQWGRQVGGVFDVFAPYDEALQNDISAGQLSVDSVITDTGEEIKFDKKENINFTYLFESKYNNKTKEWDIVNRRLHGSSRLFSDSAALKDKNISKVKGTLTIRLPEHTSYFDLGAGNLGITEKSKNGIYAKISAYEDWNTYIDLHGPVEDVMRFLPYSKNGKVLNTANERINEKQYQTWGLSREDKAKVEALPKRWQGMITIYGEPEKIRVYYANDFEYINHKFQFNLTK